MKKAFLYILIAAVSTLSSCIENDIPYPRVVPEFKSISVDESNSVTINAMDYTVEVNLKETADLHGVKVSGVTFKDDMTVASPDLNSVFDLSQPLKFKLRTYQDYEWTMQATQVIERYFTVRGQIGASIVDPSGCRVVVNVSNKAKLDRLEVLSCKLGPEKITEYSVDPLEIHDFTQPVAISVSVRGKTENWTIFAEPVEASVEIGKIDAWTRVAWISASGTEGQECGFRFRKAGTPDWQEVSGSSLEVSGGSFKAALDGLEPETLYECTAFCGAEETETVTFTTEAEQQLPNSGFDIFSNAESKNFFSWYDPSLVLWSQKWWDSGNSGSTMVGASGVICAPDTEDKVEGVASARLNSRYVVIKFAAGNLFSGEFAGLVGTSGGIVDFGRPFTLRPRKLTLSLKYESGPIDNIGGKPEGSNVAIGDPDRCQVYIALGDWDFRKYGGSKESPVRVNTTARETFFDSKGSNVIAYGSYVRDSSTGGWIDVEIPLEYSDRSRKPTHIIVSCAASMYGDYFTGSSSSTLWIDRMKLEY